MRIAENVHGLVKKKYPTLEKDFNAIHGKIYDYSLSVYSGNKNKIIIICKKHNKFTQTPNAHLQGQGCPKCGKINMAKTQSLENDSFIKKAIAVHGKKYDYKKVIYKKLQKK